MSRTISNNNDYEHWIIDKRQNMLIKTTGKTTRYNNL